MSPRIDRYLAELPSGNVEWIGVRPASRQPMQPCQTVKAIAGSGLEGDHRTKKTPGSGRQVTLISREHMALIAHHLGKQPIQPELLRRNIVISGINLLALRYQQVQIGGAVLQITAPCDPCFRMNEALGEGGLAAMLGLGGLCAKIIQDGEISIGDSVGLVKGVKANITSPQLSFIDEKFDE